MHYCSSRTQVVESFCGVAEVLPSRRVVPVLDQTSQGVLRVLVELPVQLEQHHILQVDRVIAVVQGARRRAPCPPDAAVAGRGSERQVHVARNPEAGADCMRGEVALA